MSARPRGTLALSLLLQVEVIFTALFTELNIQMDPLCPLPGLFWEGTDKRSHPGVGRGSPVPPPPRGRQWPDLLSPASPSQDPLSRRGLRPKASDDVQSSSVCSAEIQKPVIMNTRQKPIKQNKHKSKGPQSHSGLAGKSGASPVPPEWLVPWYKSSGRCPPLKQP